jgi:hypothetical protein
VKRLAPESQLRGNNTRTVQDRGKGRERGRASNQKSISKAKRVDCREELGSRD